MIASCYNNLGSSGLGELRRVAFFDGQPLCLYGDPAYPLGVHLQAPYKRNLTPQMALFNKAMSEVRVSVEWIFGNITNYFKFIDFKKQMKVNLSPVGKIYFVCALLHNAHTCLHGNEVSDFFQLKPPSLEDYFFVDMFCLSVIVLMKIEFGVMCTSNIYQTRTIPVFSGMCRMVISAHIHSLLTIPL